MLSRAQEHNQEDLLLDAFRAAIGCQLDSDQIRQVEGIGQVTARLSGLRKRGYRFNTRVLPGSNNKKIYTYIGRASEAEIKSAQADRQLQDNHAALTAVEPATWADLNGRHGRIIVAAGRVVFKPKSQKSQATLLRSLQPSQPSLALS